DSIPPGYSAVTVSGAGESVSLRLPDVFDPCSLVTVNPCALRGDTAFFDLDSQQSWLSGTGSFVLVCGLEPGTRMVLSDIHLREEEIESRIGMHREALERISM
ncbi:hypothetical protein GX411_08035, partial [Candidatus Fermentibacteria bacterium]|nr:hypothetical protein [Candidatus Fermentibacteria bacterium]